MGEGETREARFEKAVDPHASLVRRDFRGLDAGGGRLNWFGRFRRRSSGRFIWRTGPLLPLLRCPLRPVGKSMLLRKRRAPILSPRPGDLPSAAGLPRSSAAACHIMFRMQGYTSAPPPPSRVEHGNNVHRIVAYAVDHHIAKPGYGKDPSSWNAARPGREGQHREALNRTFDPRHDARCSCRIILGDVFMDSLDVSKRARIVADRHFVRRSNTARASSSLA